VEESATYEQLFYTTVIPKLKELNFDGSKIWNSSKLNMEERCAFVFVHFKKFHKHKNKGKTSDKEFKQIPKVNLSTLINPPVCVSPDGSPLEPIRS